MPIPVDNLVRCEMQQLSKILRTIGAVTCCWLSNHAIAEAEYYALDGQVIPSHGSELILIDHHDLTPGQREESVFVVCDKSQNLLWAVNAFISRTSFPL